MGKSWVNISKIHGSFGFETWGLIDSFTGLESYRVFIEASSTSCEFYKNNSSKYGCAYRNDVYVDGYQYDNANIGHSSDGDSITLSLGEFLVAENSQLIKSKITMGQLNRALLVLISSKKTALIISLILCWGITLIFIGLIYLWVVSI